VVVVDSATPPKRAMCPRCERPETVCLCDAMVQVNSPVEVIIWQDPTEARHKLSTAPLLHKSLPGSRLLVADELTPEQVFGSDNLVGCALLYPLDQGEVVTAEHKAEVQKLLILDGTWRKVRRLIHLNPWLNQLPYVALNPEYQSQYRIRKSPREDGLSTIEAGVAALSWLDQQQDYLPVLNVLEKMVSLQEQLTPERRSNRREN